MRPSIAASLAVLALGAGALVGCGGSDDETATFDEEGFPFTFEFPGDFERADDISFDQSLGGAADEDVAFGLDDDNAILIQRITLNQPVDETNLQVAKQEIDGLLADLSPAGGEAGETAGFPSLEYPSVPLDDPAQGESRLLFLFDGDQEFVLNCQSTPDERDQVEEACEQMRETLAPAG
jgi:hypothetical protein